MRRAAKVKPSYQTAPDEAGQPPAKPDRRQSFRKGEEVVMPSGRPATVVRVEADCVTVRYADTRKAVEEAFISPRYLARWQ